MLHSLTHIYRRIMSCDVLIKIPAKKLNCTQTWKTDFFLSLNERRRKIAQCAMIPWNGGIFTMEYAIQQKIGTWHNARKRAKSNNNCKHTPAALNCITLIAYPNELKWKNRKVKRSFFYIVSLAKKKSTILPPGSPQPRANVSIGEV